MTDEYTALAEKVVALEKLVDALLLCHLSPQPVRFMPDYDRVHAAIDILYPRIERRLKELLS